MASIADRQAAQPRFSWDPNVPATAFWADLPYYEVAGHFTRCFDASEISSMDLDSRQGLPPTEKTKLLYGILVDKLDKRGKQEGGIEAFKASSFEEWRDLNGAKFSIEDDLGMPEAEATARLMIKNPRNGKDDAGSKMCLIKILTDKGSYEEAEQLSEGVIQELENHPKLGRASPQVMGQVRNLIALRWKQGKMEEAKVLIADGHKRIDEMAETDFAKYVDEEREELNDVVKKLQLISQ